MAESLNISLLQLDLVWENKSANLQLFDNLIERIDKTDIIILPEMFSTGFTMNPYDYWEPSDGPVLSWMRKIASKKNTAICGSIIVKEGSNYFNRFLFVTDEGIKVHYDKRHLFRMGEENQHYSAGKERVVFEYQGWRIMPQICYDLRFPVWYRNRNDYDLLINVANWPAVRSKVWTTLLSARAIENQCYLASVNRIGPDANGLEHIGDSMLIDFKGDIIESINNKEGIITQTLSLKKLYEFREKFPAYLDSDDFSI